MDPQTVKVFKILAIIAVLYVAYRMFLMKPHAEGFSELSWGPYPPKTTAGLEQASASDTTDTAMPMGCQPPQSISTDLLPKATGVPEDFAQFAPSPAALKNQNFMDATKFIGIDTVGNTLKNANYDLRADPPNPKVDVGPWNQSNIEPDLMRKPLE